MSQPASVVTFRGGMPVVSPTADLPVPQQATYDGLAAALASANAAIVALTQRVAALEGKPDPCVALSGTLPIATMQIGTVDVHVAVPGLLSTDRIAVEIIADVPTGVQIGSMRPSPAANGDLIVQVTAVSLQPNRAALPLGVTALR